MSISPVPYTRQVKLNYPNKLLKASVSEIIGTEYWPYPNEATDPWYEGSSSKKFHRWEITMRVDSLSHGSHLTRQPFSYNGLDVSVGDWIGGASDAKCCRIVSISAKTRDTVTCVVEDYLRYNTFKSSSGNGIFGGGAAVIFSLNEEGYPLLDPLPSTVSSNFATIVSSRFQYLNPQSNYVLEQTGHNFEKSDAISITSSGFVKANATTVGTFVGVVTENGPGPNFFMLLPNNQIYDFDPALPGLRGEYVYVDNSGNLSNVSTVTSRPVFLVIENSVATVLAGDQPNPEILDGNVIVLNDVSVTFSGSGGSSNTQEIANQINVDSSNHNVVASVVTFPSTVESNALNSAYGQIGGFTPFSAQINTGTGNTLINFTSNGSQYAGVSSPLDMKADIDAANIADLLVEANENDINLSDLNGNSILIYNETNDTNNTAFAGPNSITGFDLVTPAVTATQLTLTRFDGGEILISEDSDVFQNETGIFSGHTGRLPLAMNIEQGVRTGGIYVVADINARDGLIPLPGDQAYVVNAGGGEWATFQWTGDAWVEIGNLDSAATDARTFETTFTMPLGLGETVQLGNISPSRKIIEISVDVTTAFSGGFADPEITVGTSVDPDQFFTSLEADLTEATVFQSRPEYVYPTVNTQDMVVEATVVTGGSTSGEATVRVTYV